MNEEYYTLLKPLTNSLDKPQGEKHNYLGYVTPTLIALRKPLIQSTNLKHSRPLCLSKKDLIIDPKNKNILLRL
ncbi:Dimer Tnp hAT domain-containing protein [Aphis craccivora]|uniref:Dimer Tnp hAT domain-containing protein n=1 Tax=Aphis craccivora TaxID=307492 RepID=A0A6G0Z3W8_APHCR|nr:Dimer Tnp hAT domain-containing protein [Aphis craccivora]